ncbi:MAG TPA: efflux RND transporter periplasmic adaptor subunit [Bacteroidales bacterium]|nr:efflux RND transporter periplasmic adaptor subunit [Bacteroidales bacterium]
MKKGNKTITMILLIVVIAGVIFYPKLKPLFASGPEKGMAVPGGPGDSRGQGQMNRQALSVSGFLIRPIRLTDNIIQTGTLKADEEVDLSFETSGKLISINFTEGTRVKKGDLLAKINDKPLQAQLEKLVAQQKLSEAMEFRQRSLLDKDAISQESYDQIVTELHTIQADINLVKARISETELRAPFDGVIGLRYVSEGTYTNANTKIARLVKMSPLKIDFSISERYSNVVKVGYPVTFMVDEKAYDAKVYAVDPKIELDTKSVLLRAVYPNKNEELKPGRFVSVVLQLNEMNDAVAIPAEALVPEMEGEIVYVLRNGKAEVIKVTTGLRTESQVQVTDGLSFGDTLLTSGILQLRQGMPIILDTLVSK